MTPLAIATDARVAIAILEDDLGAIARGKKRAHGSARKQLAKLWTAVDAMAAALEQQTHPGVIIPIDQPPAVTEAERELDAEPELEAEITTPPPGLQRVREVLAAIPRPPREIVAAPTKRPVGGRPSPCAIHREETHPAAIARRAGRPHRRDLNLGGSESPAWKRISAAVQRGELPVGPVTLPQIRKAIGSNHQPLSQIALTLSEQREPVRLREVGRGKWVIALV